MNTLILGLLGVSAWTLVVAVAAVVGTYLFLRNNKRKRAKIDAAVAGLKDTVDKLK